MIYTIILSPDTWLCAFRPRRIFCWIKQHSPEADFSPGQVARFGTPLLARLNTPPPADANNDVLFEDMSVQPFITQSLPAVAPTYGAHVTCKL
jgi:hypothetical protein